MVSRPHLPLAFRSLITTMSIPLLVGVLAFVIVIAAAAGVWRARGRGTSTVQSSLMLLVLAVIAVGLVWFVLQGR